MFHDCLHRVLPGICTAFEAWVVGMWRRHLFLHRDEILLLCCSTRPVATCFTRLNEEDAGHVDLGKA